MGTLSKSNYEESQVNSVSIEEGASLSTLYAEETLSALSCYRIDPNKKIIRPEPLLLQGDIPIYSRGNISVMGGKAKSRKTFNVALQAAAFLSGEYMGLRSGITDGSVLIIDTEQSSDFTQKLYFCVNRICGYDLHYTNPRLNIYALRELSFMDRCEAIEKLIHYHRPDLVFIDGIRDLIADFNSIQESSAIVQLMMKLSSIYNCHIVNILHTNKIDSNLRGHLGTELNNKCETAIIVESDGETSTVRPESTRNRPFEEYSFRIDDDESGLGIPVSCTSSKVEEKIDNYYYIFSSLLPNATAMTHSALKEALMQSLEKSESSAKKYIREASELEVITKREDGNYQMNPQWIIREITNDRLGQRVIP